MRTPKERWHLFPGFYMAVGDRGEDMRGPVVRLYWHLRTTESHVLIEQVTTRLNGASIPFRCKIATSNNCLSRTDGAVIYLSEPQTRAAIHSLQELHASLSPLLQEGTPLFTRPLAKGFACAIGSPDGTSFGYERCRLAASALWAAFEAGVTEGDMLSAVENHISESGVQPDALELGPNGEGREIIDFLTRQLERQNGVAQPSAAPLNRERLETKKGLLQAAMVIGQELLTSAYEHNTMLNWLQPTSGSDTIDEMLGPSVYDGTAGVAIFFSDLYVVCEEERFRTGARGSILTAMKLAEHKCGSRLSVYSGELGVALAAVRVGTQIGDAQLVDWGIHSIGACFERAEPNASQFDVIGGAAGAILGLVGAWPLLDCVAATRWLQEQTRFLMARSNIAAGLRSWRLGDGDYQGADAARPLLGFAHGAAGCGLALLQASTLVDGAPLAVAAHEAFAYEDNWFARTGRIWPDFRVRRGSSVSPRSPVAWCHGAAGIGLSRAYAAKCGSKAALGTLEICLSSTRAEILSRHGSDGTDGSPCHGLGGLIELVITCESQTEAMDFAHETWRRWLETNQPTSIVGLMTGQAGVGHGLLRAAAPESVKSILNPSEWIPISASR